MLAKLSRSILPAALLCPALAAGQGLYWESTSTGGPGARPDDPPRLARSYAMPRKLKRQDADSAIIARLDRGVIYLLRLKEKTYEEIVIAELEAGQKRAAKEIEALRERLKDQPEEARQAFEKRLQAQGVGDPTVEVTRTEETKQLAGYLCTRYSGKQGGKETLSVWATKEIKGFDALRADWLEVTKRVASMSPAMGKNRGLAFEKIEGFPMESVMGSVRTVVTKVEERATPDSEFEVPAGFTRKASPAPPGDVPARKTSGDEKRKKE
jgi:hypothetical protein